MRPRARSPQMSGQEVCGAFVPGWERSPGFPVLRVDGDLERGR